MRKILLVALACAVAAPAMAKSKSKVRKVSPEVRKAAAEAQFRTALGRLDPQTRLEQVCDLEAMKRIKQEQKVPTDRAQGAASAEPKTEGHTLTATGGAFRSKGAWYELSFVCQASADHMKVLSFEYQTGKAIPQAKWEDYGLWR
jgi:hypothetical protein